MVALLHGMKIQITWLSSWVIWNKNSKHTKDSVSDIRLAEPLPSLPIFPNLTPEESYTDFKHIPECHNDMILIVDMFPMILILYRHSNITSYVKVSIMMTIKAMHTVLYCPWLCSTCQLWWCVSGLGMGYQNALWFISHISHHNTAHT